MATRRRRPADRGNSAAAPGRPWQLGGGARLPVATRRRRSADRGNTAARAAVQHTHSQARAAVQHTHTHTNTSEARYATHALTSEGRCINATHTHTKRGPLCRTQMLTSAGRWAAVQDTNAHKRGTLCNTHAHKARAAATHYIDISIRIVALSILPAEDVVVAMSVSCVWDVAGDGSGFLFFIKTYAYL